MQQLLQSLLLLLCVASPVCHVSSVLYYPQGSLGQQPFVIVGMAVIHLLDQHIHEEFGVLGSERYRRSSQFQQACKTFVVLAVGQ